MHTRNLAHRQRRFLDRRTDENGVARMDLWLRGVKQLRRMNRVVREARPAPTPAGAAAARTIFSAVSWQLIGPQPLRIDAEQNTQGKGPDSGEVVDIAIDPSGTTDQTIYIATNNGGVWKSVDGGASWRPKTDFMPSMSMGALALDPVDPLIVYAGTGNNFDGGDQHIRGAGIYKSVDGGETWTQLSEALFLGNHIIRIVIPTPNVLLVATDAGLFRSVDGGASFGAAPGFNDGNAVIPATPANLISDLALDKLDPATVYASQAGVGILVSTDGGVTFPNNLFTATNNAPTAPFDRISFAQAASNPSIMYALVTDNSVPPPGVRFKGLFRSDSKGASWTLMPSAAARAGENGGLQDQYDLTLGVDPGNANRVCIGFQELYLSLDGGQNFPPAITANQVHFDHHAVTFSPHPPAGTNPTPFYVGTDGGIARNNDGNPNNWDLLNETVATNLFLMIDIGRNSPQNNAVTYGGSQDTGICENKPGFTGLDWHEGVNGDGRTVVVDPQDPTRAFGRDVDSMVTTTNGGVQWNFPTAASSGLPVVPNRADSAGHPLGVDPNNSAIVYVTSSLGSAISVAPTPDARLFRSTNSGAAFALMKDFRTLTASATHITAFANTKLDSKILMVGCDDGTVFRTANADQGATAVWTPVAVTNAPSQEVTCIAIDPTDAKVVVVTYAGTNATPAGALTRHVFFSQDVTTTALTDIGGTANGDPNANVPDLPVHTAVFDHSTTPHSIIIGCDVAVLRTADGGATWHLFGAGLPNTDCTSLAADYSLSPPLIRLGTYGRGVYELSRVSGPRVFVSSNLAFGSVPTGASGNLTFDIFNIGDATLTITGIDDPSASANPVFTLVAPPAMPFDISPGDRTTITVSFAPTAPGKQIAMFSVRTSDPTHAVFGVPLSGFATFAGPQVTGIIPSKGAAAGGTAVTIHGSGFTGATAVRFGTLAATGTTVDSDTQISAVTPPGSGDVDVVVVTPSGTTAVNPASKFTYLGAAISVTGINPSEGPETGGTAVVISGTGLGGATQVLFGGFAASGFTQNSDTQITAVSPAGSGVVDVLVATISGTSSISAADKFRYTMPGGGVASGGGGGTNTFNSGTGAGATTGDDDILHALADILRTGTDPEVLQAQRILLRRIALEGNIIDSRVPPPKNITEIGGYLNLLTTLGQIDIRTQTLASTLGVAGPATSVGLSGEGPAVAFINMPNDRPPGDAQPTFATTISVRTDMADAWAGAMQRIHGLGCALPLSTPPRTLPVATPGQPLQPDFLQILGRVLQVAPAALLVQPATDPVSIAHLSSNPADPWQLVLLEIDGRTRIAIASWVAYQATDSDVSITPPAQRRYFPIASVLADAGWYSSQPFQAPTSSVAQGSVPRLVNITGLVRGHTSLGDELRLLYPIGAVMSSALTPMLSWIWNGTTFVPPGPPTGM